MFLSTVKKLKKRLWLRSVIVPGLNDTEDYIVNLKNYIHNIPNVEKVELLPYHLYGVDKYKELKIKYPLENIRPMDLDKLEKLEKLLH